MFPSTSLSLPTYLLLALIPSSPSSYPHPYLSAQVATQHIPVETIPPSIFHGISKAFSNGMNTGFGIGIGGYGGGGGIMFAYGSGFGSSDESGHTIGKLVGEDHGSNDGGKKWGGEFAPHGRIRNLHLLRLKV